MFTWTFVTIESRRPWADFLGPVALGTRWRHLGPHGWIDGCRGGRIDRGRAQPRPHHDRRRADLHLRHADARPAFAVVEMILRGSSLRLRWRFRTRRPQCSSRSPWLAPRQSPSTNDNNKTSTISLPGPFNGCTYFDPGRHAHARRRSWTSSSLGLPHDQRREPLGEGGPIASAELTSLKPETVVYTITPNRNGATANPSTRATWWPGGSTRARS
jgi:hypothetical protein